MSAEPLQLGICSDTHGAPLPDWEGGKLLAVLHGGDFYDGPSLPDDEFERSPGPHGGLLRIDAHRTRADYEANPLTPEV